MCSLTEIKAFLADEWQVLKGAPVTSIMVLILGATFSFALVVWHYEGSYGAHIQYLNARIEHCEGKPSVTQGYSDSTGFLSSSEDVDKFRKNIKKDDNILRSVKITWYEGCEECEEMAARINRVINSTDGWEGGYYGPRNHNVPSSFNVVVNSNASPSLVWGGEALADAIKELGKTVKIDKNPSPSIPLTDLWLIIGKQ